jgi:hypothetical protein
MKEAEPVILKHTDKSTGKTIETPYFMVKDRIKEFRKDHPQWPLITNLEKMEGGNVVFSAKIHNDTGEVIATGWAWESVSNGYINKFSAVENCETSAIGRALANLGYGTDGAYASYEEMQKSVDDDTKDILFELLRNSTFDDERKVYLESDIKNCTLESVSQLFDLFSNNQIPAIDRPNPGQKAIQLELDKIDKNPKK